MKKFLVRTDLALEARESFPGDGGEIKGVILTEYYNEETDVKVTKVEITNEEGSKAMRKPIGNYITLEARQLFENDEDYHREVSIELAKYIEQLLMQICGKGSFSVLVVGLGNEKVTSDSFGPRVLGNLNINRHVNEGRQQVSVSGLIPGVMAMTGMETAEIIEGVVKQTKPDAVIAIDALAARSVSRLGTTIQLSDTGIQPGSGVGNHRHSLTEQSLGVPVIAIGIPTVVSAAAIVSDTLDALTGALRKGMSNSAMADMIENMNEEEQFQLLNELLEPRFGPMFVTPKDIDARVKQLSYTVSEGLNIAFADID